MSKRYESNICNLHGKKMRKTVVGTSYGLACPGNKAEFINAKRKQCMGCVVRLWPFRRLAIIYHCKMCDSIKKERLSNVN